MLESPCLRRALPLTWIGRFALQRIYLSGLGLWLTSWTKPLDASWSRDNPENSIKFMDRQRKKCLWVQLLQVRPVGAPITTREQLIRFRSCSWIIQRYSPEALVSVQYPNLKSHVYLSDEKERQTRQEVSRDTWINSLTSGQQSTHGLKTLQSTADF